MGLLNKFKPGTHIESHEPPKEVAQAQAAKLLEDAKKRSNKSNVTIITQ